MIIPKTQVATFYISALNTVAKVEKNRSCTDLPTRQKERDSYTKMSGVFFRIIVLSDHYFHW